MLVIAIDGTAGSGKSTLALRLARRLGYRYVDSGATYRIVGLAALLRNVPLDDPEALTELAGSLNIEIRQEDNRREPTYYLAGVDVTVQIRSPEVSQAASIVSAVAGVRKAMVALQRRLGEGSGIVMEGRDIGTVVLPQADLKFFIDAPVDVRAERRHAQQLVNGMAQPMERVEAELVTRDSRDSHREASPLRPAEDAIVIDSSGRGIDELEEELLSNVVKAEAQKEG